jgi:hypothetical protein
MVIKDRIRAEPDFMNEIGSKHRAKLEAGLQSRGAFARGTGAVDGSESPEGLGTGSAFPRGEDVGTSRYEQDLAVLKKAAGKPPKAV